MKKLLLIILFLSFGVSAQMTLRQTLSISGGISKANIGSKRYVLFQSIGQQSVINTFNVEQKNLRQGFIQPLGPAALADDALVLSLILYPNPFVDTINIDFEEEPVEGIYVSLFDMMGRQVFLKEYEISQNLNVPIGNISSGGYFINIQSGERKNVKQLIKF